MSNALVLMNLHPIVKLVNDGLGTSTAKFILTHGKGGARPADAYFYPKSGYALFRQVYSTANEWNNDLSLVFDFGPSKNFHGHKDAMNFMLYGHGTSLIIDSGGPLTRTHLKNASNAQ
jgi:hypothetical protein